MSDKQTNIPTVEETNSLLSAPVRPAGYVAPEEQPDNAQETFPCDACDFVAKSAIGLKSHQRKHNTK